MDKFCLPLVLLSAIPVALLHGQLPQTMPAFQNLTPKYDGSAVTFSTRLRLQGEAGVGLYPREKIFGWEAAASQAMRRPRAVHIASDTGVFAVLVHALLDAAKQFKPVAGRGGNGRHPAYFFLDQNDVSLAVQDVVTFWAPTSSFFR